MQNETPFPKTPIKGELLCKLIDRYPSIELSTIQIISHVQAISKALSLKVNHDLAQHELTEGKLYVLAFIFSEELFGNDDPSPSQIAEHVGVTRGTVTGLLDGLERDGFLERIHDSRDRRGLTIRLTDKSRSFLDTFLPNLTHGLSQALSLSPDEKRELISSLGRIETALADLAPPTSETS